VPVIRDDTGRVLLCKMAAHRGVFPGQWGLPGGGAEPGETLREALERETREETALTLTEARPLFFKDAKLPKTLPDGSQREIYMVFLLFDCRVAPGEPHLNEEFSEHAWVAPENLGAYDLNPETRDTFARLGWMA